MGLLIANISIALIWLGLSETRDAVTFCTGLVVGFVLLYLFRNLFSESKYIRKTLAFFGFIYAFIKAFISSNITIAIAVLFKPVSKMEPHIVTLDVSDLSQFEMLLLSHSITLTPGTTTIEISSDGKTLYIHAFDGADPNALRESIYTELRDPILRFTR